METDLVRDTPYPVPRCTTLYREDAIEIERRAADKNPKQSMALRDATGQASAWTVSRFRRAIDVIVASIALTLFSPIMCAAAIAVRLSSAGPVLFRQKRMGRNGLIFTVYKFRSMRITTEQSSFVTASGDTRITRVGNILRKCKLDELPQFWNVLRGDMSLVGPRPKLPHLEPLHLPCRPGITGAATLAFRYEEEMLSRVPREHLDAYYEKFVKPSKAKIDWEYMQSASWKTDLDILWHTAKSCISSRESPYRVNLPEYAEAMHEFTLQETGTDAQPAFSASLV